MARPRIEIDWKEFDKLCALQCTLDEFANHFECSVDTIERAVLRDHKQSFAEYFKVKRGRGKLSLRRRQFQKAMDGDTAMLIFLGKQWLDQTDKNKHELTGTDGGPVETHIIITNMDDDDTA